MFPAFKLMILGVIQGLTEFLPISSSGHLVIAQKFLGINHEVVFLDVLLHLGTLLAILTFFFRDVIAVLKNPRVLGYILVATFLTGLIGLSFRNFFESLFSRAEYVALFLILNGIILLLTKFFRDRQRSLQGIDSILFGLAQGLAVIPGISRSGLTISVLLARGIKIEEAFRFSFMASLPAIFAASLLKIKQTLPLPGVRITDLLVGVATSYAFGLLALFILMPIVKNKKFYVFGYYCILLGLTMIYFLKQV